MPSRQDQLHSYQYSVQRVVAALVSHDPDPHRSPMRRAGMTALVSFVIAALAVGAVAIYGLLTGATSKNIDNPAAVYVEKGTGARFVFNGTDKLLHPVLNYSSALLAATGQAPEVISASHQQLAKVPLGAPLGIPGAPDSLPAADDLLSGPWSVCTTIGDNEVEAKSTLSVGAPVTSGTLLSATGQAWLVSSGGRSYLVHNGKRYQFPGDRTQVDRALGVLGWTAMPIRPVAAAFLNALPQGMDLKPPTVPGRPGASSVLTGFRTGQLITDATAGGAARQWAVVLADGKAPITQMQSQMMIAAGARPVPVGAEFAPMVTSGTALSDAGSADGMPAGVPALNGEIRNACLTLPGYDDTSDAGKSAAGLRVGVTVPAGVPVIAGATAPSATLADLVVIPRGEGTVVMSTGSPSAAVGTISLITDTGLSYAVADGAALSQLGYGNARLPKVPSALVSLLPQGPALNPVQARRTAPVNGQ